MMNHSSSDYRIDYKAKRGINFQHFDYIFYKVADDVLLQFEDAEKNMPALNETLLKNIGAVILTFIKKNKLCETIAFIHYNTNSNEQSIHISMNWPDCSYKQSEFSNKLLEFISDYANNMKGKWDNDRLYVTLEEKNYYFLKNELESAISILKEFITLSINEGRLYYLPEAIEGDGCI